ncbi:MAG: nitronate monooxygenase [Alphaproteobacteria bacterium]|nr:nitronate monooxygenase [Alphaproteobacteria bacterium]MBL6937688.1 nitronate monooxygenase [Alphaproteobacteria bacterium]MBL7099026.1 nitronate monooxygenase [Alphaproteobacteria bacterium]
MTGWRDRRILELFGIEVPILQAPMAGAQGSQLAVAVSEAGGLGALPCALLSPARMDAEMDAIRAATKKPVNVNFFCHAPPHADTARDAAWRAALRPAYEALGLDPQMPLGDANRAPFDATFCALVEKWRPEVVSFHFGLPETALLERVRATGAKIIASATTVGEAVWLEQRGCDAIIAQGYEAGGHRGIFLTNDVAMQPGTFALVPQVADAVKVPVIAAGGIGESRGIAAAFVLGASAVQMGTAYLFCPESSISPLYRGALAEARDDSTALTNVFSGRPARGIANKIVRELGPLSPTAPEFPLAGAAIAPLRAASEQAGSTDYMQMWSGQAARFGRAMPAGKLTKTLAAETLALAR